MIVGYFPGGTIKNARVVLKPDETLPNRYNVLESEVLRQDRETFEEVLIKPIGSILPPDSDILSNPELQLGTILNLTIPADGGNLYKHADIIRLDEADEESDAGDSTDDGVDGGDSDFLVS